MAEFWSACRLGDVLQREIARVGASPAPVVLSSTKHEGLVPSLKYFKGRQIFSDDLSAYRIVKPGWFAYATNHLPEGSIGLNERKETGCVSPMYTVFSVQQHVDQRYLIHLLKSPELIAQYKIHEQASVDRRGSIRFEVFAKIPISLPPLEEQKRVADVLDAIDDVMQATEKVVAKLSSLRNGAVESQLSAIEGQYGHKSLLEVVSPPNGQVDPRREPFCSLVLVAPDHIVANGEGILMNRVTAREQGAISGKYQFKTGDVIYSKIRPELRKAWLATFDGLCSADMYPLSPSSKIHGGYLASVILGQRFSRFAVSVSGRSSGMPKVNRRELAEFQIAIPPLDVQETIARLAGSFERRIESETAILRKMIDIRSVLAADLLFGRVRTVAA